MNAYKPISPKPVDAAQAREHKGLCLSVETSADDPGTLDGYLAVFGNVDATGEVIRKGAFARSIATAIPAGKVPLMARHFRDGGDALECVGTIVSAREDDFGLWVRARQATRMRRCCARASARGHITGLTVVYFTVRWTTRAPVTRAEQRAAEAQDRATIVEWLEARLVEGTLTVRPTNDLARIARNVTS